LWLLSHFSTGNENEQRLESTKRRRVTVDRGSGTCATSPKIKLNELEDVRRELANVYHEAGRGIIDTRGAGLLAYILTVIGKLIEATDIEKRLLQIERKTPEMILLRRVEMLKAASLQTRDAGYKVARLGEDESYGDGTMRPELPLTESRRSNLCL
jgi:hypothetical protein